VKRECRYGIGIRLPRRRLSGAYGYLLQIVSVGIEDLEFGEELLYVEVQGSVPLQACLLAEGGGIDALSDTCRSRDQKVLAALDEPGVCEPKYTGLIQSLWRGKVVLLDTGAVSEPGLSMMSVVPLHQVLPL
jgi:hypothetical protein